MGDAELRELERRAEEGPEAYRAWLTQLVRSRHERALAAEDFGVKLGAFAEGARESLARQTQSWKVRLPSLDAKVLLPVLRDALKPIATGFTGVGYGFRVFGRLYEGGRSNWDEIEDFEQLEDPLVPLVFAADLEGELILGFGTSFTRKASPGTTFPALSPWRTNVKPETMERRLRRWRDETAGLVRFPRDAVELWLAIDALEKEGEAAVREVPRSKRDLDYASEKQVGFVHSLRRKKGLDDEAFLDLLRQYSGLRSASKLEYLGRGEASDLIDALLLLPDRRGSKAKAAVSEDLPPAPFEDLPPAPFEDAPPAKKAPAKKKSPAKKGKKATAGAGKVLWDGVILAVQPRISMTLIGGDEQHGYKGYTLYLRGQLDGAPREFSVGIGKAAQAKHGFQAGLVVSGAGAPAPPNEGIDLYKASKLQVVEETPLPAQEGPPWTGKPLELPVYRAAGHRTLAATALDGPPCSECIHGCLMPVDEHGERTLSAECYGPRDCSAFVAGAR